MLVATETVYTSSESQNDYNTSDSAVFEFFKFSAASEAINDEPAPSFDLVGPAFYDDDDRQPELIKSFNATAYRPSYDSSDSLVFLRWPTVKWAGILPATADL